MMHSKKNNSLKMKTNINISGLLSLIVLLSMVSCITGKKYQALEARYQETSISEKSKENQLENLQQRITKLENELEFMRQENGQLKNELLLTQEEKYKEVKHLQEKYSNLEKAHQDLLHNSAMEARIKNEALTQLKDQNTYPSYTAPNEVKNNNPSNTNPDKTNSTNKTFQNTGLFNAEVPNENLDYAKDVDKSKLNVLMQQVSQALSGFSKDEVKVVTYNNRVYVLLSDDMLFAGKNNQISKEGLSALKNLGSFLKSRADIVLSIESEAENTETNPLGYDKAKPIAQIFSDFGLSFSFHKKNFAPLAFDTSGTQIKKTQTSLVLSLK